ncbi:hypothetical protein [Natronomonas sp. CBA1123]
MFIRYWALLLSLVLRFYSGHIKEYSSDEAPTGLYICTDCGHRWRRD